jgi:hypothetical protein
MKISAMTNTADLSGRLAVFSQIVGKEISETIRQHARLACVTLANTTQPYSGKDEEGSSTSKEGKRIGEQSILNDVSKVFYTANEPTLGYENALKKKVDQSKRSEKSKASFKSKIERYCRSGNSGQLAWLAGFFKTERVQLDGFDRGLYSAARTGRRTNVPKKTKMLALVIGANAELEKFKKERMQRAGMGKAGWAVCAEAIPVKQAQSATRGIPQWVTRHKGRAKGSIVDMSHDLENPRVKMTNLMPWVSELLSPSAAKYALHLTRDKFVKYMNSAIKGTLRAQAKLQAA